MTNTTKHSDDDLWVSLSDFKLISKRMRNKIILSACILGAVAVFYALTRPIEYISTAAFREKATNSVGVTTGGLTAMLLNGSSGQSNHSEAISTMKSRTMISRLVQELGLQASLVPKKGKIESLTNIMHNLVVEYALLRKKQGPVFADMLPEVTVQNIRYDGEVPLGMHVTFVSDDTFQIASSRREDPLTGTVGRPVVMKGATFTIIRNHNLPLVQKEYVLCISPLLKAVEHVSAKLNIDTDKEDKTLLRLKYADLNRHRTAEVLNRLMDIYRQHLKEEQRRISDEQIAYLETRQEEMQSCLRHMMGEHATVLAADITHLGFPDAMTAMNFFSAMQQQYMQQQLGIDLELKRLEEARSGTGAISEKIIQTNDSTGMNTIVQRIRLLKQQADSIELALGNDWSNRSEVAVNSETISQLFEKLKDVRNLATEANTIAATVESSVLPDVKMTLFKDPRFKVRSWCDKLKSTQEASQERIICTQHFLTYLNNLQHLFQVYQNVIEERLTHQRDIQREFQGIDLDTAKELYLGYSRELSNTEAEAAQKRFTITQLEDPAFEISSLSAVLRDPVSEKMITEASPLVLALKDENNRTEKEHQRSRNELLVHKGFLSAHLNQMVQLLELHENLLKEKIQSLQAATLGLIQQEVSLLENHLADQIDGRLEQLSQERKVIDQHQQNLQEMASKLPEKWVAEKLIDQQMELNRRMVEEITKLVESKNTSSNLELVQSAPVDSAIPPVQPKSPLTLFFAIFGVAFGGLLMMGFGIVKAIATGMPVTEENLKLAGHKVAGKLSGRYQEDSTKPLPDQDLETLRRLILLLKGSMVTEPTQGRTIALVQGSEGVNYSLHLASLLAKKRDKVLLMSLFFDQPSEEHGLLQYLEGHDSKPQVTHREDYDLIMPGGISRFAHELFDTENFHKLLKDLEAQYDWIFLITHARPDSAEAGQLIQLCDQSVVTIDDHTWNDIKPALKVSPGTNLVFLIA